MHGITYYKKLAKPLYKGRAYHGWHHVTEMLGLLDDYELSTTLARQLKKAIILHDAYPVEKDCIHLIHPDDPDRDVVERLILSTELGHRPVDELEVILHDLDYHMLLHNYPEYSRLVWKEYDIANSKKTMLARLESLQWILSYPLSYGTRDCEDEYWAMVNIVAEIQQLRDLIDGVAELDESFLATLNGGRRNVQVPDR